MNQRILLSLLAAILLSNISLRAEPIKLTVHPAGANAVEITFGPVLTNLYYEVLARTNGPDGHWIQFGGRFSLNNTRISMVVNLGAIPGLSLETLPDWTLAAGRWDDPDGDELPPLYKELVLRSDPYSPGDPYGNPAGDGWINLQKLQNNMDPYTSSFPPSPQFDVKFYDSKTNGRYANAMLTWEIQNGPTPDYFIVEKARRYQQRVTNVFRPMPVSPNGYYHYIRPTGPTNHGQIWRTNRLFRPPANYPVNALTNRPFNSRFPNGFPGGFFGYTNITGPFVEVARMPGRPGLKTYHYVDANIDIFLPPLYRLQTHHTPPMRARLNGVGASPIRNTLISASAFSTASGFDVTVTNPIPYATYLLLVRDRNDPQWRASGYFQSGTNRDPVRLRADKKGMLSEGQRPLAMPKSHFLPEVVDPEFIAGWGEDSDGDGLPDIYEVLVTHTAPDKADTGNTGILDGFKQMTSDGWNNLEKFRCRANPLIPASLPRTLELTKPTATQIFQAFAPKTDLPCEVEFEIKTNSAIGFQPLENAPGMLSKILDYHDPARPRDFDLRISWAFIEPSFRTYDLPFPERGPAWYGVVEPLIEKINLKIIEALKTHLETNPPLSWSQATNQIAEIVKSYRRGGTDKGLIMVELTLLSDNVAQDFYGRVIDQNGDPVPAATVSASPNLDAGRRSSQETQTDSQGCFQIVGLRGESLNIAVKKPGFTIEGHGVGIHNKNGPETSLSDRATLTMWKLKGAEPMIHNSENYKLKPDNRMYTIDLLSKKMVEGRDAAGDLVVQFQLPGHINNREHYPWSFTMSVLHGGLLQVTNDDYLNEAPQRGYNPIYSVNVASSDSKWRDYDEATFYVKARKGSIYGHIM
jgi:hypothetical protein